MRQHFSDCAALNAPATEPKDCNCDGYNIGVCERKNAPGEWGVEAINVDGDAEIKMAIFSGPEAKELAIEYAEMKYGYEFNKGS